MKFIKYTLVIIIGLIVTACEGDVQLTPETYKHVPSVDFSFNPKTAITGEKLTFTGSQGKLSSQIKEWQWNFGDANSSMATGKMVSFTYQNAGNYEVVLTARDVNGKTAQATHTINVQKKAFQASIVWSFSTGDKITKQNLASVPDIGDNGDIYYIEGFVGNKGYLVAVNDGSSSASLKWKVTTGHTLKGAAAIAPDGNLVIGDWANPSLHKISSADGSILWDGKTVRGMTVSTPAVDETGNIYFGTKGSANSGFTSYSPSGTFRWRDKDVGDIYTSPALSNNGKTVYFYSQGTGILSAANTTNGKFKWGLKVASDGAYGTSLAIGSDGTVYVTTGSDVVAVTDNGSSGTVKWKKGVTSPNRSGIVIGPNGNLYTGSQEGLVSLSPDDGSINWINDALVINQSVPAVDSDGNIYVGSINGKLAIFDSTGKLLKEFTLGSGAVYTPVIADNGTIYVAAEDNNIMKLYKITVPSSNGPASSNWPMKGQNRKHNGHA